MSVLSTVLPSTSRYAEISQALWIHRHSLLLRSDKIQRTSQKLPLVLKEETKSTSDFSLVVPCHA